MTRSEINNYNMILKETQQREYKNQLWQLMKRLEIKKLQYDINWEAAKISALSSRKIDKYEYLTGEEILPPD